MKQSAVLIFSISVMLGGCTPYPHVAQAPVPLTPEQQRECAMIRREIARQQRIATLSPVMETLLVEGAVRLNTYTVITGLEQRAAIEGCPLVYSWNGTHFGPNRRYTI
ncbi:MAG TPA: hypothetical protein VMI30_09055 [Stellaceae bacterium]|nr:hypothetical protein [Stellaceae bacterium]